MSKDKQNVSLERRAFCAGSLSLAALGPLALAGCGAGGQSGSASATSAESGGGRLLAESTVVGRTFVHPGLLHTEADFDRMRAKVAAGAQPWLNGWNALLNTGRSHLNNSPRPLATVIRGGDGSNYAQLYIDVARAYQLAVRWKVSGDTAYADKAVQFLNAWAYTLTSITGNADRFLAAGIYGYEFANAAEIMRTYSGYAAADFAQFQNMMLNVFYPLNHQFLVQHNDADITNYWANWDQCTLASILAIGVLCDREDLYNEAVTYYKTGLGNGAASRAVYYIHPGYLGQWQESGRDQGHSTLGIGLAGAFCEMAWNQGDDFYGYDNNRFLAGTEYVAKSNLTDANGNYYYTSMPFSTYRNINGTQTAISNASLPTLRPVFEMVYNHYVNRLGLAAPYTAMMAAAVRAEGDGSNGDQLGLGTLTFTRDPIAAGANPSGLTSRLKAGQVELSWWGTAYATSYNVKRATTPGGPYTTIAGGITDLLTYTDSGMSPGTYYYVVTAMTPSGETGVSNEAKVITANQLHTYLAFDETSGTTASDATGNGHNATLINGPVWTAGRSGNAISLDGVNDYLELPAGIVSDLADFTIATWVYWNASQTWARIFDFGSNTGYYMFLSPRAGNGTARFAITNSANYGEQVISGNTALPTGQWVHVAVTLSGTTGTLYINGNVAGTNTSIAFAPFRLGSTTQNWIGRSQYADPYFNGKLDDFRIYNGALSAAEITALIQS
ncbi:MAG TPA: LamG-like jellyroll fold domain-containing protein [Noviherbaspirillum sp.]